MTERASHPAPAFAPHGPDHRRPLNNRRSRAGGNPLCATVVPAQAGTHSAQPSFPRRRQPNFAQPSFPRRRQPTLRNRHSRAGGNPLCATVIPAQAGTHFVPAQAGTHSAQPSFPRRREPTLLNRHSRAGGNPLIAQPSTVIPAQAATHFAQPSFPRRREPRGGGAGMGSRLHGNDGRRRRNHTVIPPSGVATKPISPKAEHPQS